MSAAPDMTCIYSVCLVCQWYCVEISEPTWKLMIVGGILEVLNEVGGEKEKVMDSGGGR